MKRHFMAWIIFLFIYSAIGFAQHNEYVGAPPQPPVRTIVPQAAQPLHDAPTIRPQAQPPLIINLIIHAGQGYNVDVSNDVFVSPLEYATLHDGTYRLQVGAFAGTACAENCFNRLQSAGFSPAYEQYGGLSRVVIPGVAPNAVSLFVQRLEAAGFFDVWIREEQ